MSLCAKKNWYANKISADSGNFWCLFQHKEQVLEKRRWCIFLIDWSTAILSIVVRWIFNELLDLKYLGYSVNWKTSSELTCTWNTTDLVKPIYNFYVVKVQEFWQSFNIGRYIWIFSKIKIQHSKMTKTAYFDHQKVNVNSESHKVNIMIFLTLSNVEFPLKIIIQYLQNDQNSRFCPPKSAKYDFT